MNSTKTSAITHVVTIDGPAASGKSSVSREIARRLGWKWISTGAFYRGLAYVSLAQNIAATDEAKLIPLATNSCWRVEMTPENTLVFYHNKDVTNEIFSERVGTAASQISSLPGVRRALLEAQRTCAKNVAGLVAEGRDCGTVVFPNAAVKIYLTADSEMRAQRRAKEQGLNVVQTHRQQQARDQQDSTRSVAPLQIPENAHVVETSALGLSEVVEHVYQIVTKQLS